MSQKSYRAVIVSEDERCVLGRRQPRPCNSPRVRRGEPAITVDEAQLGVGPPESRADDID